MTSNKITIRIDAETDNKLERIAVKEHKSKSDIVRSLISRGLKEDGYSADDDRLHHTVKNALKELLDPAVNRLAAIGAKNAQMAGADFMFQIFFAKLISGAEGIAQIDEMAEQARLSGIEMLKAKDDKVAEIFNRARKNTNDYLF